jgi:hypothetical protein
MWLKLNAKGHHVHHVLLLCFALVFFWPLQLFCVLFCFANEYVDVALRVMVMVMYLCWQDDNHPGGARRDTQSAGGVGRA